jgi:hypothetical protein
MQLSLSASLAAALALPSTPSSIMPQRPALSLETRTTDEDARALVLDLQGAEQKANEEPSAGVGPLEAALERYEALAFDVARDSKAHEARVYAMLALARAHLSLDQPEDAQRIMDEAIRIARGDPLPAKTFGPRLLELYEKRMAAPENAPKGQVVVECTPACDVLLNARLAGSGRKVELSDIPLGAHRVRARSSDRDIDRSIDERFVLTADQPTMRLELAPTDEDDARPSTSPNATTTRITDSPSGQRRLLPRWAGIVGVATGAAALIAGGVLLGFHGRCPDGSDPSGENACVNVLSTRNPGIAMLAVGGAIFTGFGVVLILDETRARRRRTSGAMLGYTIRF